MQRRAVILFLLSLNALYLFSQDSTRILDEVTITARRKEEKKLLVPYSIESVSKSQLDQYQPRTTPEALMSVNGVFVQKTNHGSGSPFIRGLTGNQTLILIDGIRLNNSTFRYGPNQYLNTIDPYSIDRIEVAKGTGSVQYGSDALGGVIHIFTADPSFSDKPLWTGKATGKIMTDGMEKTARGEARYSGKKFAAQLGGTYRSFGDLLGGDTTGRQTPSGYDEFAFDGKLKFLLHDRVNLFVAHQFLQQQEVPVYHKVKLENFAVNAFDVQQRMLNYAKLNWRIKSSVFQKLEIIAHWQQTIEGRESRKNGSSTLRKEKDKINTAGLTADLSSRFSGVWTANSGIEYYADRVNSNRQDLNITNGSRTSMRGLYPDDSKYLNYSIYSLHHFDFSKWIIEAGARLNNFSIGINDTSLGKVNVSPSCLVYNISAMYHLSARQHLFAQLSTGYRSPNVDDLATLGIVDFRYEVPTDDLAPERSRNVEVGYKLQTSRFSAAIAGYYMQLDNLIARVKEDGRVVSGYPVYRKENIEKAYIKGAEADLSYMPLQNLLLKGSVAYTHGVNLTKSEPLRRIPPMFGTLSTRYRKNRWFGSAEFLFASKQERLAQGDKEDNRIPLGGTPGWKVVNLYGGYQLPHLRFQTGFQNLFNEDYRLHGSGINGAGRSAWLAVSVKI